MIGLKIGPMQLAILTAAAAVAAWLAASVVLAWVQRVVVQLAFRHLLLAGVTTGAGILLERHGAAGLLRIVIEVASGALPLVV